MRRPGARRRAAALSAAITTAALLLVGCTPPGAARTETVHLTVDGIERSARVTSPAADDADRLPVVIALHGAGQNAARFDELTRFPDAVAERRFVLVTPSGTGANGLTLGWNAGACCQAAEGDVDDIAFLEDLVARVARDHPIDSERVYLAGFSNGGMLAYRAACERGERIAAIAVVAGSQVVDECPAPSAMAVYAMHGTADPTVPYDGGEPVRPPYPGAPLWENRSVAESLGFWAERDLCAGAPAATVDGPVTRQVWPGCRIVLDTVRGGEHTWFGAPGSREAGREPAGTPSATARILDFFELDPADPRSGTDPRVE
ncbi:polyhydroxybutyrate depolymerase [Diaminobutyricimonas aerilata]|uniref:Polyhydroxybutyrate depolymerase n=1 Tax=Diaminobutyricimonas aerilata TaxID=1162967 RepID=A0A2M9CKR2_9MICO|nr:alpha/beta fold hydrolase [Diaminobutyricimonas aerilata]PJJ72493.1 polyhydroxybutyrate depolymerase [Diaminobutyricimonas aerilata]